MMKNPHPSRVRLYVLLGLFVAVVVLFIGVLCWAQLVHGSEYRAKSIASNATSETVTASRGIITDRSGRVLVSNRLSYTLTLSRAPFTDEKKRVDDAALNAAIWRLIELCQSTDTPWTDTLPLRAQPPLLYLGSRGDEAFTAFLDDAELDASLPAGEMLTALRTLFAIDESYTAAQARLIAGVRYELYSHSSYVFADDVSADVISQIIDGRFTGVTTGTANLRVYNTTYASHILGRITRIYAEDWDEYNALGYSMDALVGESGAEKAFESYLHGRNGTRLITTDSEGKITGELYTTEPQPGGTVALTIDIDLQAAAEDALAATIESMIDEDSNERGGAAVVMQVGTGEVLALASYPTCDLANFSANYEAMLADDRLPMFNRATDGVYAPGSTFKMCTAAAALENGVITPSSTIVDQGIYTYYKDPQPMCWVWRQGHYTHGRVNVSQAITVSCNYFFYEVGRLTGIRAIDDYASQFGLGRTTGIEIGDSAGALASPEYADSHNLEWTDGQTLTAAIGQSYNLFTPLQLANYVATIVSGGEHYAAHLLKSVKTFDNASLVYVYDKPAENTVSLSETTLQAITTGMHNLTTGSLSGAFSRCTVSAGAKTGSAQVGTDIANGVFVCYAPYENPEIAVAIVIEKGGSGAALASTAVDIINAYFAGSQTGSTVSGENALLK